MNSGKTDEMWQIYRTFLFYEEEKLQKEKKLLEFTD